MKEKYRRQTSFEQKIRPKTREELTDSLRSAILKVVPGRTYVRNESVITCTYCIDYKPETSLCITDVEASTIVLLVEKFHELPRYDNRDVQQAVKTMAKQYASVFKQGIITNEIQTYRDGVRITPVSVTQLYLPAISKVKGRKQIGGVFCLWQNVDNMNTIFREFKDLSAQYTHLPEPQRNLHSAMFTKTGSLLTSSGYKPAYVLPKQEFILALFLR